MSTGKNTLDSQTRVRNGRQRGMVLGDVARTVGARCRILPSLDPSSSTTQKSTSSSSGRMSAGELFATSSTNPALKDLDRQLAQLNEEISGYVQRTKDLEQTARLQGLNDQEKAYLRGIRLALAMAKERREKIVEIRQKYRPLPPIKPKPAKTGVRIECDSEKYPEQPFRPCAADRDNPRAMQMAAKFNRTWPGRTKK